MKRILALILVLALFAAVIPAGVSASTEEEVCNKITSDYYAALSATGKESLGGYCGLMTSWQLYLMGINSYLVTADGNRQFDTYCNMDYTTGGHKVRAYSAGDYSLLEALQSISSYGTEDVYNILVGFEWTNTEAGAQYGHAVVVYAILDGVVYFTEGFQASYGGSAGQVSKLSIERFVRYYDDWTTFEGVIYFGRPDYKFQCTYYPANAYAKSVTAAPIHTQPCELTQADTDVQLLRTAAQGERFWVTGVYETPGGDYYYQVQELEGAAYIPAEHLSIEEVSFTDVTLQDAVLPTALKEKEQFELGGTVACSYSEVTAVCLMVKDHTGILRMQHMPQKTDGSFSLGGYLCRKEINFAQLPEGQYTVSVYADCKSYQVVDGEITSREDSVLVQEAEFTVGNVSPVSRSSANVTYQVKNGWVRNGEDWYFYRNNAPQTGWLTYDNVRYYLDATGRAATGWCYIQGNRYLFTKTGALRTSGWASTQGGKCYLSESGVPLNGWQTIDGQLYGFDMRGFLICNDWLTRDGKQYFLKADGTPIQDGWFTVQGRRCYFGADGSLLTELVQSGEKVYLKTPENPLTVSSLLDENK